MKLKPRLKGLDDIRDAYRGARRARHLRTHNGAEIRSAYIDEYRPPIITFDESATLRDYQRKAIKRLAHTVVWANFSPD